MSRTALLLLAMLAASGAEPLKPVCAGLMDRDWKGQALPPCIDSAVVMVNWNELQRDDGTFTGPGWAHIDRARAVPGMRWRLRILCGIHAPNLVKRIGGAGMPDAEHGTAADDGGIAVWNQWDRKGGTIPRFWLPAVLDRYEALIAEVARRYDADPAICEVVDAACMTMYAEPFYRAHGDTGSNRRLVEAGLTWELDRAAHERAIRIHERYLRRTRTSLAINSWDIAGSGAHRADFKPTAAFVDWARRLMGGRLVLQNNGLGTDGGPPPGSTQGNHHFAYLAAFDGPKGFQTRTWPRLGGEQAGLVTTLGLALGMGAWFVELPVGWQKCDPQMLADWDRRFEAQTSR